MRNLWLTLILALAFAGWGKVLTAQVETEVRQGLRQTTFTTENGKVSVYLPDILKKGDQISGTVIAEPDGKNSRIWEKNKTELNGYVIELKEASDNKAVVEEDFFQWTIPAALTGGVLHYVLKDDKGNVIASEEIAVAEMDGLPLSSTQIALPPVVVEGGLTPVYGGIFDGNLMNTRIKAGNKPAFILAESPRASFFVSPEDVLGLQTIWVTDGEEVQQQSVNFVTIDLSTDQTRLLRGQTTTLLVTIQGLEGIKVPVPLSITNGSPETVTLSGGNEQIITILPESVGENGIYKDNFTVMAKETGAFSIYAEIQMEPMLLNADGTPLECPPIPMQMLEAPTAPEGYVYVGRTVVINYTYREDWSTIPLERDPHPDDVVKIESKTEKLENGRICDYIVTHVYERRNVN